MTRRPATYPSSTMLVIKDATEKTYTMSATEFCERAAMYCDDAEQVMAAYRFLKEGWNDQSDCLFRVGDVDDHHEVMEALAESIEWACELVTGPNYERYWTSDPQ